MCERRTWKTRLLAAATFACGSALAPEPAGAQAPANICALATSEEFQQAYGINPQIGILPDAPELTDVTWGQHCDYADGAIDLFSTKTSAELDRVLGLTNAVKQRVPVPGIGDRAFFTITYPDDEYRRRGFLAVYAGSRLVAFSMDDKAGEPVESTRPKLERLAKLALPRLK
jgi:hypothetical protein